MTDSQKTEAHYNPCKTTLYIVNSMNSSKYLHPDTLNLQVC